MTLDRVKKFIEPCNIDSNSIYYDKSANIVLLMDGDGADVIDLNKDTLESFYLGGLNKIWNDNSKFDKITLDEFKELLE